MLCFLNKLSQLDFKLCVLWLPARVWATPTIWVQAFEGCVPNLVDLPLPSALTIQTPPPSQHPFVCPTPTGSLAWRRADRQGRNWYHVTVDLWVCFFFLLFVFPSQPIWWKDKKYSVPSGESLRKLFPYQQDSIVDRWAANLLNLWLAGPLTRKNSLFNSCLSQLPGTGAFRDSLLLWRGKQKDHKTYIPLHTPDKTRRHTSQHFTPGCTNQHLHSCEFIECVGLDGTLKII